MKLKIKTKLNLENLLILNVVLFSVVAILHFFRVVTMVPIFIGEYELPVWLNVIAIIFLVFLIWQTWIKTNKSKKICAKILIGIFIADLIGVIYSWYHNIEFFGFTSTSYAIIALFDAIIIMFLFWYVNNK